MADDYKPGVYVIRHPTTALNSSDPSKDKIRGWWDVPLDAFGRQQSKQLARYAEALKPDEVYCSDLSRARDMARMIATACKVKLEVRKEYRPWHLGKFQGMSSADVIPQLKAYIRDPEKKVPGGESWQEFMERWIGQLRDCLSDHVLDGRTIVGVTHYRNMKAAEAWIKAGMPGDCTRIDMPTFEKDDLPNGALMRIWLEGGRFRYEISKTPVSTSDEQIGVKKAPETVTGRRIGIRTVRSGLPKAA